LLFRFTLPGDALLCAITQARRHRETIPTSIIIIINITIIGVTLPGDMAASSGPRNIGGHLRETKGDFLEWQAHDFDDPFPYLLFCFALFLSSAFASLSPNTIQSGCYLTSFWRSILECGAAPSLLRLHFLLLQKALFGFLQLSLS